MALRHDAALGRDTALGQDCPSSTKIELPQKISVPAARPWLQEQPGSRGPGAAQQGKQSSPTTSLPPQLALRCPQRFTRALHHAPFQQGPLAIASNFIALEELAGTIALSDDFSLPSYNLAVGAHECSAWQSPSAPQALLTGGKGYIPMQQNLPSSSTRCFE